MSKIYYLMGKSSTGKDTIYKELRKRMPQLKNVTIYTTRPRREGEKEGEEYFFTDETELEKFKTEGRLIEERATIQFMVSGTISPLMTDSSILNKKIRIIS